MANNLTDAVLKHFGGLSKNSLLSILENVDDLDSTISVVSESPYIDTKDFCDYINTFPHDFSYISLNIQSLNAKFNQLTIFIELLANHGITLGAICLQETWISEKTHINLFSLDGYTPILFPASCSLHSGLVIYLHNSFNYDVRSVSFNNHVWEGLFLDIFHDSFDKKLTLCNIYRPPRPRNNDIDLFLNDIIPIIDVLINEASNIAVCGDFNIDLLQIDHRIKYSEYLDIFITNGFKSNISLPTRFSERNATLIDHIFTKLNSNARTKSGIIYSNISDHLPCFMSISFKNKFEPRPKFIKVQKKNSNSFKEFYEEISYTDFLTLINNDINNDPSINYSILENKLNELLGKHFPIKTVRFNKYKHKCSSWITEGILKSIKFRDQLYRNLKSCNKISHNYSIQNQNLKTYNNILNKTIRNAKQSYYFSQFNTHRKDSKNTWKVINSILNSSKHKKTFPNFFLIDDTKVTNKDIIADRFNKFFSHIGSSLASKLRSSHSPTFSTYLDSSISYSFNFRDVTQEELIKIISCFKPKASSGPDGLSMKILKNIAIYLCPSLSVIINQSLHTGIFPNCLKIAKVLPLYKKDSKFHFDNYRPISLLPCMSKVFEKAVYNQIYEYFDKHKLFNKNQHGFRKSHSTESASLEFVGHILSSLENTGIAFSLFIDLSKAFDTISHDILLNKLKYYGIKNTPLSWFSSYLSDRKQFVDYDGTISNYETLTTGVPQGSVLGPLLFLIYMNDISFVSNKFNFVLYADDTSLEAPLSSFECLASVSGALVSDEINTELNKLFLWLCANKLTMNLEKTKYMLFHCKQRRLVPTLDIKINNTPIERVKSFNFLGITLTENLSWKDHICSVSKKISKVIGLLRRIRSFTPPSTLLLLYSSLILPHLQYGILLWGSSGDRLLKLQKKALRVIFSMKFNAHTDPIFKSFNILKVHDLFFLNALKFYFKYKNDMLPDYFQTFFAETVTHHSYNTRQRNVPRQTVSSLALGKTYIKYYLPKFVQSTPVSILSKTETHSLKGFTLYVKTSCLQKYETECTITNCHICAN